MSSINEAEGYVQLLMQEGKLEEEIIRETCNIFHINKTEAARLVYEYKTTKPKQYKENVNSNLKQRALLAIPLIIYGLFYILFSLELKSFFFYRLLY